MEEKRQQSRTVPSSAFQCNVGQWELGDNGEEAKSAPINLMALSGAPIDHWFFGKLVHDLDGMTIPERFAIDYVHDPKEIIGYVNKASIENKQLELSGALTPFKDSDRATEIIHKSKMGVPYQASIDYTPTSPDEILMEELGEGKTATVNGNDVVGPALIVRKSTLHGVAVCPHGADSNTSAFVQNRNDSEKEITVMSHEENKTEEEEPVEDEGQHKQTASEGEAETQDVEEAAADAPEASESEEEAQEEATHEAEEDPRAEFKQFAKGFGEVLGAKYYAQGLEYSDAMEQYAADLKAENEQLKANAAAAQAGAEFDPTNSGDEAEDSGVSLSDEEIAMVTKLAKQRGEDPAERIAKIVEQRKRRQK